MGTMGSPRPRWERGALGGRNVYQSGFRCIKMKISQIFSIKRGSDARNQAGSLSSLGEQDDSRNNSRWRVDASAKSMGVKRPTAER